MSKAYRFFIVKVPAQKYGSEIIKNIETSPCLTDEELREIAKKAIENNEKWLKMVVEKGLIVVCDVGVSKQHNGLGASYPDETIVLFKN